MAQKTTIVTLRLSAREAKRVAAVQELTRLDKATLLRDFIEDGLRNRVLASYRDGAITAQVASNILDLSLREFLALLEKNRIPVNWDTDQIREYMTKHYG
jgi:predicted HTH domain antitoxin